VSKKCVPTHSLKSHTPVVYTEVSHPYCLHREFTPIRIVYTEVSPPYCLHGCFFGDDGSCCAPRVRHCEQCRVKHVWTAHLIPVGAAVVAAAVESADQCVTVVVFVFVVNVVVVVSVVVNNGVVCSPLEVRAWGSHTETGWRSWSRRPDASSLQATELVDALRCEQVQSSARWWCHASLSSQHTHTHTHTHTHMHTHPHTHTHTHTHAHPHTHTHTHTHTTHTPTRARAHTHTHTHTHTH
jgi:hypothetical protein